MPAVSASSRSCLIEDHLLSTQLGNDFPMQQRPSADRQLSSAQVRKLPFGSRPKTAIGTGVVFRFDKDLHPALRARPDK